MATEKQALDALGQFGDKLSNLSNVVGLGVVPMQETSGASEKEMAVAVYVEKKLPKAKIAKDQFVPRVLELKRNGKKVNVRTRVIEQGKVSLEEAPSLDRL